MPLLETARRSAVIRCVTCFVAASGALALSEPGAVAQDRQKSVLSLYSAIRDGSTATTTDPIVRRTLDEGLHGRLDYYAEFIDLERFPDAGYQQAARQFLRVKYEGKKFDVILAMGDSVLGFAMRNRDDMMFRDTPIVFINSTRSEAGPNTTGLIARLRMKDTLDAALAVQPDTERVVVVSGASTFDKFYEAVAREEFKPFEGRVAFRYLIGLPMPELLQQVSALPAHSIVFFTVLSEDGNGQKFLPTEELDSLSATANVPMYTWHRSGLDHGAVGGQMLSNDVLVTRTAELALRVLRGERADTIPITDINWNVNEYDWRQLRRWGISEARLPAGSVIRFRQPGAWELYQRYIVGGSLLVLLQTAFIAALLVQQSRRRRAETALRESEGRFRLMADTAPVLVWRSGVDKRCDFFNRPWLEFTGRTVEQELGDGWAEGVHPDDLDRCLRVYTSSFDARQPFRMEYRLRRADGEYRWLLDSGVPRYGPDGMFAGYIGSCVDITERRATERENEELMSQLQGVTGRLIAAQESERARIARDLHDDVSQQIAGLAIALSGLKRRIGVRPDGEPLRGDVSSLQEQMTAVAENIRQLSHALHPSVLEHAGLVAALSSHCAELRHHQSVTVTFSSDGDFERTDPAAGLCLYRVAQEALRNVIKHADARHACVQLVRIGDLAELTIADDGKGFDVTQVRHRVEGLGLVSISERVRLAGGTTSIATEPHKGTRVQVRIPIARLARSSTGDPSEHAARTEERSTIQSSTQNTVRSGGQSRMSGYLFVI